MIDLSFSNSFVIVICLQFSVAFNSDHGMGFGTKITAVTALASPPLHQTLHGSLTSLPPAASTIAFLLLQVVEQQQRRVVFD